MELNPEIPRTTRSDGTSIDVRAEMLDDFTAITAECTPTGVIFGPAYTGGTRLVHHGGVGTARFGVAAVADRLVGADRSVVTVLDTLDDTLGRDP